MNFPTSGRPLIDLDIVNCSKPINGNSTALWAVIAVETDGVGFFPDGKPAILFERHIFHQKTDGAWDKKYPEISNSVRGGYGASGQHQYTKLKLAYECNPDAALESASWGIGQVMGEHWKALGYPSVQDFVEKMCLSEGAQLDAMARFIQWQSLQRFLEKQDWAGFARRYNGSQYGVKHYDVQLLQRYQSFSAGGAPDIRIRAIQLMLKYASITDAGLDPGAVDGWLGRRTQSAIAEYANRIAKPEHDLDDTYATLIKNRDAEKSFIFDNTR